MSHPSRSHVLALGVSLAASTALAKPNDKLAISPDAPSEVRAAFEDWVKNDRITGRIEICYGIALAGENDCRAAGASCAGAGAKCGGAQADSGDGSDSSVKPAVSGHPGNPAVPMGDAVGCAGQPTVDFQGNEWTYVPKGTCVFIQTPEGPGSLAPLERTRPPADQPTEK